MKVDILKWEHRLAFFLKTFYLLRQQKKPSISPLISLEVYCDCADCFIFSWKKLKANADFSSQRICIFLTYEKFAH